MSKATTTNYMKNRKLPNNATYRTNEKARDKGDKGDKAF
jgi:hypothetical protein